MFFSFWKLLKTRLYSLYKWFFRIWSTKVFKIIAPEYIENDRLFYYGNYPRFVNGIKMESAPWTYETILFELKSLVWDNTSILDYGCGMHKSAYLRTLYGNRVTSADILDFDINNFLKINIKDSSLPISDKQFDISIASEVIEHVFSPFLLIEELIRVSKKYIIISTPNPASLKSRKLFKKTWFLYWFAPSNWEYHVTPVFYWQIERFLHEKNLSFRRYANHSFYDLKWDDVLYAESFIYIISINK